ncbi:tyrosine-protein phosphatase [Paenibacillus glycanilyticus]|uniref:Tyrosine-protein phosphatase n=1 Tax=Paenibacillus glycanilyticus TaxID=126569 RepID=A0ABQ6GL90_9BACL|nr:CpsB/CapC family capsule biosynthesis tyrosine phosphatase [Paenibacillus glycanilyticus]GLX70128.1 tyrosine protein phosphatase [Paenibacillus glycanilyticus]
MIDIHTHILPGIDDGAADWDYSIKLARAAAAEGITGIIATPHHYDGKYSNEKETVIELTAELNNRLLGLDIPITIQSGQEIRVHSEFLTNWQGGRLLPMGNSSYVLIEMPSSQIPKSMEQIVYELRLIGIRTVIAHPERNAEVVQHPDRLAELIDLGACAQVTTHSLLGGFGRGIEKSAWNLCRRGLIHVVSSDAHHLEWRGFRMKEAYERVEAEMGPVWRRYFEGNAQAIWDGRALTDQPSLTQSASKAGGWGKLKSLFGK